MTSFRTHFINNQLHDEFHTLFPDSNITQTQPYYSDSSCRICYPPEEPDRYFQYFWQWYYIEFPIFADYFLVQF
jgi:hypothetical protein